MPKIGRIKTGVYAVYNSISCKFYVGSSARSLVDRWAEHRRTLRDGKHKNRYLQAAWNKHGEASFTFYVLQRCHPDKCVEAEQIWIDNLKAADRRFGYNLSPTAASTLGTKLSPETCARISRSKIGVLVGRKMSIESRMNLSIAMRGNKNGLGKGKPMPVERRMRMIDDLTGKRYGRLVVVKFHDVKPHARWVCRCDCGKETICYGNNLKKGISRSCGCLLTEVLLERNKTVLAIPHTEEHKQKIRVAMIGNKNNPRSR